jgi:hypothetical protein
MSDQPLPEPAGVATEPAVKDAGTPGSQPEDFKAQFEQSQREAGEWKKRFIGLQGAYQRDQQKWQTDSARVRELETLIAGFDDDRKTLRGELEANATALTELEVVKGSLERLKTITSEYSDLLPFEKDGLLPDGVGDELRTRLNAFREKLAALGKLAIEQKLEGSVPPKPKGETPRNSSELLQAAIGEMKKGNPQEYQRLYDDYLQAVKAGG